MAVAVKSLIESRAKFGDASDGKSGQPASPRSELALFAGCTLTGPWRHSAVWQGKAVTEGSRGHWTECMEGPAWPSFRSKRSRFITLVQAATKSFTNFSFDPAQA